MWARAPTLGMWARAPKLGTCAQTPKLGMWARTPTWAMNQPVDRWFNTAGPCDPRDHYMIPASRRLGSAPLLIDRKSYFVVHAPRQVGKTTTLRALAHELLGSGRYAAALLSVEVGARLSLDEAEPAILDAWRRAAEVLLPSELRPPPWPVAATGVRIAAGLDAWARACPRPLVLFLDEVDALGGDVLHALLRQLRDGYMARPEAFPWSLALVGLRDVRDYRTDGPESLLGTSSPFNIKVESLTLLDFTFEELELLYLQHTDSTGQIFEPKALARAFWATNGQPWLANALARQLVDVLVPDRARPITEKEVETAESILIERQDTHLDSLVHRLREPRVRAVLEPMLAGTQLGDIPAEEIRFVLDLGLVRMGEAGGLEVTNPIYREIIVRELSFSTRAALPTIAPTWLSATGSIDFERLLDAFLQFWRQHGEALLGTAPYHEVAPHLVLMAFLHRVVNGGGSLQREYAIGRGRMDLHLSYGEDRLGIELKVWRDGRPDPVGQGLSQLGSYLEQLGIDRGWLVVFDRRSNRPPIAERTEHTPMRTPRGHEVEVIRA